MDILLKHPSCKVDNKNVASSTNKAWAKKYGNITKRQLNLHTYFREDTSVRADWSPLVAQCDDDIKRRAQPSYEPNPRSKHVLDNEDDMAILFQVDYLAPVLSKFTTHPPIHHSGKALPKDGRGGVFVDSKFVWNNNIVVIGEYKRNIFDGEAWLNGKFEKDKEQVRLSQEIRGYAEAYECPQIYLFDGRWLALFQFRARRLKHFSDCDVDCWIFPRLEVNSNNIGYPLRDALYRFIVQGLRRCQSAKIEPPTLAGVTSTRAFFSGEALWDASPSRTYDHPLGYYRNTNEEGILVWMHGNTPVYDQHGSTVPDSERLWKSSRQTIMYTSEDIYTAG